MTGTNTTNPILQAGNAAVTVSVPVAITGGNTYFTGRQSNSSIPGQDSAIPDTAILAYVLATIPQKLITVPSINAFTVANNLLYTVPTGKTLTPTGLILRVTSATGTFTAGPTVGLGNASGTSNIFSAQALGATFNAPLVTFDFPVAGGISLAVAAGGGVYLNNTVAPTGGTALVYQAALFGFLE